MILDEQLKWDRHKEEQCKIISNNIAVRSMQTLDSINWLQLEKLLKQQE